MTEWSSDFPYFLQFKSEFGNKEFMIWAIVCSQSCFWWLYRASPSSAAKSIINLISILTIMMSMFRVLSCHWKRVFAMTSVFSWQNSVSLCPTSFCTPRPNTPVTPGISWLPSFAFQSPMIKRTSFFVLVLEGLHWTIQLQLLQYYWSSNRPGLLWYWMVCLGNKQRSFCHFWDCTHVLHFRLFCWLWWPLHFF